MFTYIVSMGMAPGIVPEIDCAFKWLFGNVKRLQSPAPLLDAVLADAQQEQVVITRILNPFSEDVVNGPVFDSGYQCYSPACPPVQCGNQVKTPLYG